MGGAVCASLRRAPVVNSSRPEEGVASLELASLVSGVTSAGAASSVVPATAGVGRAAAQ